MKIATFVQLYWHNRFASVPVMVAQLDLPAAELSQSQSLSAAKSAHLLEIAPEIDQLLVSVMAAQSLGAQIRSGQKIDSLDLAAALAICLYRRGGEITRVFGKMRNDPVHGDAFYLACEDPVVARSAAQSAVVLVNEFFQPEGLSGGMLSPGWPNSTERKVSWKRERETPGFKPSEAA